MHDVQPPWLSKLLFTPWHFRQNHKWTIEDDFLDFNYVRLYWNSMAEYISECISNSISVKLRVIFKRIRIHARQNVRSLWGSLQEDNVITLIFEALLTFHFMPSPAATKKWGHCMVWSTFTNHSITVISSFNLTPFTWGYPDFSSNGIFSRFNGAAPKP